MNFVLDPLKASSSCRFPPPLPRFSFTLASFFGFLTYNSRFSFFFFFFASACFKRWNESVPSTERRERKEWKAQKRLNRIWPSRSRHPRMKSAPGLNAHSVTHNEPILDLWERQRETLPFIPRIVSTIMIAYIYMHTYDKQINLDRSKSGYTSPLLVNNVNSRANNSPANSISTYGIWIFSERDEAWQSGGER